MFVLRAGCFGIDRRGLGRTQLGFRLRHGFVAADSGTIEDRWLSTTVPA